MLVKLSSKHIDIIKNIEDSCFSHPLSLQNIKSSLENDKYYFVGFETDEEIVGYGSVFIVSNEAYINNIAVLNQYRKQNIGSKILSNITDFAKNNDCEFITLEVRESNNAAINLYEKNGFKKICIRNNYYDNPIENAIIMTKMFGDAK